LDGAVIQNKLYHKGCKGIIRLVEIILLLLLAVYCDIRIYKIKNAIILLFTAAGLLTGFLSQGAHGLLMSLSGMLLPLILLFPLYALKMLGAGDIKLLCAVGSIAGSGTILYTIAYSFLAGGVIALAIMIIRKNGKQRIRCFLNYLKTCFLAQSFQPYGNFLGKSDGSKFRFSYAIACGA
jgi:prepilin peptidase CpaA